LLFSTIRTAAYGHVGVVASVSIVPLIPAKLVTWSPWDIHTVVFSGIAASRSERSVISSPARPNSRRSARSTFAPISLQASCMP
jgi:hypothetical protein